MFGIGTWELILAIIIIIIVILGIRKLLIFVKDILTTKKESNITKLDYLNSMLEKKQITEDEYNEKKKELLDKL